MRSRDEVERFLATVEPLPGAVLLRDDELHPVLVLEAGEWGVTLVAAKKNGLPLWRPTSYWRPRREKFVMRVNLGDNEAAALAGLRRLAKELNWKARHSIATSIGTKRGFLAKMKSGWPNPGRLGGLAKAKRFKHGRFKKSAGLVPAICVDCGRRHGERPCPAKSRD